MKVEPTKIKRTLKYATVGACVATSLISTGCDEIKPQVAGEVPAIVTQTPEEVFLDGDIATTPAPTMVNLPDRGTPPPDEEVNLAGDIAVESTPQLAGGIPTPPIYDEEHEPETELELSGESAFYFEEE